MASVTKIVGVGSNETRTGSYTGWAASRVSRITVDDGSQADSDGDLQNLGYTDWLQGIMSGNEFAIAADQQIDGIEVILDDVSCNGNPDNQQGEDMYLVSSLGDSNVIDTGSEVTITETKTTHTLGGPTDTWGLSLTPSVVNASSFGVRWAVIETANSNGKKSAVDSVKITVYHSDAPSDEGNIIHID